jgi:hypothetical protein
MLPEKNIIRKQVVDIHLFKSSPSVALQQEASAWCNVELLPAIEKRLERYALMKEVIRLDVISVELANTGKELTEQLAEKISMEIERVIESKISSVSKNEVKLLQKEAGLIETLIFFLLNGYLPWWKTPADFYEQLKGISAGNFSEKEIQSLKEILHQPVAARRLASIRPLEIFPQILSMVFDINYDSLENLLVLAEKLKSIIPGKRFEENLGGDFKEQILATIIQKEKFLVRNAILRMLALVISKYKIDENDLLTFIQSHSILTEAEFSAIAQLLSNEMPFLSKEETFDKAPEKKDQQEEKQKKILKEKHAEQKEEGIYINNAGLVLIAPFLTRLFENIGITEANMLNSKELGVAIVQWLATGNEEYAEFELVFPKILCGMEPEDNVTIIDTIPATFQQEGRELLQSVIKHWSILKDTSIEGLRQNFLQRNGKLSFQKNEWLLQVEQRAYDILLQHLPWNISLIRLPWMPYILKTEWVS